MIHALPGMGADHRMYPAPWPDLFGFIAHDNDRVRDHEEPRDPHSLPAWQRNLFG